MARIIPQTGPGRLEAIPHYNRGRRGPFHVDTASTSAPDMCQPLLGLNYRSILRHGRGGGGGGR